MERILPYFRHGLRGLNEDGSLADPGADVIAGDHAHIFVMDLEMSGPDPRTHEVLDMGGVLAALEPRFPEHRSWGSRVRPLHIGTAEVGALKVVGYSPEAWRQAIALEKAVEAFTDTGAGAVLAGWGIEQDLAFLAETYRRLERPWPFARVAIDVQQVARAMLRNGEVDRFNLGHVADRLGIGRMGEHGALADAYATYDILVKLFELADARSAARADAAGS
ncbi:MAG: hypothetical protein Kow0010_23460 [Dehalococcoidia bacterium]